jgi:hypothetical protein
MDDLEGAPIPRPEGVKPMTISSNPVRSSRKSWQTALVSGFEGTVMISIAWSCVCDRDLAHLHPPRGSRRTPVSISAEI